MATTTTYELGVSGTAFTGAANREDLLDIITILSPVDAPCFTMFRKTKVSNVQVEWLVDSLSAAASDAVADGSSATFGVGGSRPRLINYLQVSREAFDVSDSQRAVNPAGIRDELTPLKSTTYNVVERSIGAGLLAVRTAMRNAVHMRGRALNWLCPSAKICQFA